MNGDGGPDVVFNDGKAPDAMRTIGEVAQALNIRQHVLRYWEEQFPTLRPVKRSGGRRYYRPEDVRLIAMIDGLVHREGYTLRGARSVIEQGSAAASSSLMASGTSGTGAAGAMDRPVQSGSVHSGPIHSGPIHPGMVTKLRVLREKLADALADA